MAAAIDGLAVTPAIEVDEDEGRGEITVVLRREKYPYPGEHELTVTLSLGAAAEGFVLGGTSSITTAFSFLPFPPTVLEVGQAEGNEGKRGAAGSDTIELGYIFEYAAGNRLNRPRAGLSVQIDFELCTDGGYGECSALPAASMTLTLDDSGSLTLRVDRTAAALSVFGEADDDSIRHGRVLLSTAGDGDFAAAAATTTFSFAVAAAVVTLSGPVPDPLPEDAAAIVGDVLSLVYSYSADDLRGRVLTGSIEVAAAIDGLAVTSAIEVDEVQGRGEITVVLRREKYPYPGEHQLAVTLSLSAAAEGFVLGGPSSITTAFSFLPFPPTVLEVRQAEGNEGKRGAAGSDTIELGYIFEYAADNRLNRPRAGLSVQVDIELCADAGSGCAILPGASQALILDGDGSLALRVDRTLAALSVFGEADDDSIRHGRVLLSTAGDGDFAAAAAATTFSFAVAAAVVTLSGPVHELLPEDATAIVGDVLSLVYSYSADDLRGRVLTGSIEVAAAIDGLAVTSAIEVDEDEGRGEITVVLRREKYPYPGEHELTVTLSLGAAAEGFVLGGTSSITTAFSFLPFPPTVLEVGQAEGNEGKRGAAGSDTIELGYIFEYAAGNRLNRPRAGLSVQVDFELCTDGGYGECSALPAASMTLTLDDSGSLTLRVDRTAAALSVFGEADDDSIRHGRVLLSTAGDGDFAAAAATTTFSFAVAAAVVTLSGPVPDPLPEDAAAIVGDVLSLVYSYSADDLRGRVLTGSIEVAAAIDGLAVTSAIEVDEVQGRGEITVVLRREKYPYPGEHQLAVTLSLSAAAEGFVLGGPSSITTPFSFLPFPPTVLEVRQAEGNEGKRGAAGSDTIELGYSFEYAADNRLDRPRAGLSVRVDVELCADAGYSDCSSLPAASMRLTLDDSGSLTLRVDRTLAVLSIFGEADDDSIRHGRVLLSTAGDGDFAAAAAATTFSFAVAATVVTLSGPEHELLPEDATAIAGDVLSLIYSYSADDLRGRVLTGSIEVAAAIDGLAVTSAIEVDEDEGRGEITVVLRREKYPYPGEHQLAVTLSLGAAAEGFVLGGPSSITTPFSFLPLPPTVLEVKQAEGNEGKRGAAGSDTIELGYIFEYAAGNRLDRPRAGLSVQVDIEFCADAGYSDCSSLPAASMTLTLDDGGSLTLRVDRTAAALSVFGEADADSIRHGRVLLSTAGDGDFAAAAATTTFSFAVTDTVVTLSGPVPVGATGISTEELSLVYSYSADDLHGRVLTGSIEVAAAIDGVAITPSIEVDEAQGRGEITVILQRLEYPEPGEHELAVTLSLSAAAEGFVLAEPSSIRTRFSFGVLVVPDTVVTLSGPVPADATGISAEELSLVYSYSADDLRGRALTGSIEVAAAIDGLAITSAIEVDEDEGVGRITVVLLRREYPGPGEHKLAVTLILSAAAEGFVLGGASSITTAFSFSPISSAINEDGTCKLGVLGPGEKCLYRGGSYYLRVLEAASGPQVFFFAPNEVGEPLNLEDASNPHNNSDFRVYNLEAIREGLGYRIIRVYSAPAYQSGELSGSLDSATIIWAVLFFFANLALGLAGGPRRWLWR